MSKRSTARLSGTGVGGLRGVVRPVLSRRRRAAPTFTALTLVSGHEQQIFFFGLPSAAGLAAAPLPPSWLICVRLRGRRASRTSVAGNVAWVVVLSLDALRVLCNGERGRE